MSMTEEELLKKIAELEKENKRLKERQSFRASIRREDAYEAVKNLLKRDMQNYQVLAEKMNISDRTLRMFAIGDSDDTTDKTLGILGNYFTEEFKSSYKDLALYRAYTNAKKPEEREQIYDRLNSLFDDFLSEFDKIYDKKIYSIKEKGIVATGEIVDGGFLVHKGSEGVRDYVKSINGELFERRRNDLISEGVIEREGDKIIFLQDYKFNSPSGAARMIIGSFANGRIRWKSEGVALKDLEPDLYEQERITNRPLGGFIYSQNSSQSEEKNQNKPVSLAYIYPLNGKRKINCTFKKPNGIFIDGVFNEEINDWTKVIPLIGKTLYEKNPVFFKKMVDGKEIVKDKGDLIIADYKLDENWNNIEGTDYYVERCFSANDVRKYAGRIIKYWNDNSGSKIDVKVRIKKTRF